MNKRQDNEFMPIALFSDDSKIYIKKKFWYISPVDR